MWNTVLICEEVAKKMSADMKISYIYILKISQTLIIVSMSEIH